jgi:hypothetical protein
MDVEDRRICKLYTMHLYADSYIHGDVRKFNASSNKYKLMGHRSMEITSINEPLIV